MMSMPICVSMVIDKLLSNTLGATSSTKANRDHSTIRPTFTGRNVYILSVMDSLLLTGAQQALGSEDQDQHQQEVGQDRRHLRHRDLQDRVSPVVKGHRVAQLLYHRHHRHV